MDDWAIPPPSLFAKCEFFDVKVPFILTLTPKPHTPHPIVQLKFEHD